MSATATFGHRTVGVLFRGLRSTMTTPILLQTILLIDNDAAAAYDVRAEIAAAGGDSFDVEWVRQLSAGIACLGKKRIAAVLLALSLPDSQGIETFDKLFATARDI